MKLVGVVLNNECQIMHMLKHNNIKSLAHYMLKHNNLHMLKQHQISCTCSNIYHQISHLQLAHSYQKLPQVNCVSYRNQLPLRTATEVLESSHYYNTTKKFICKKFEQMTNYQPACPASPLSGSSFAYPHCIQTGQLVSCIISLEKLHTVVFKFVYKKQHSAQNNNNNTSGQKQVFQKIVALG